MVAHDFMFNICVIATTVLLMRSTVQSSPVIGVVSRPRNITGDPSTALFFFRLPSTAAVAAYNRGPCETDAQCQVVDQGATCLFSQLFNRRTCSCKDAFIYKDGYCHLRGTFGLSPDVAETLIICASVAFFILCAGITLAVYRSRTRSSSDRKANLEWVRTRVAEITR